MRDVIGALAAHLAEDAAIRALVGEDSESANGYRVYGDELPLDRSEDMPRATIVVARGAGAGDYGVMRLEKCPVEIVCYGQTRLEAENLRGLAREVLKVMHRVVQDETLLHDAVPSSAPLSTRDQDAKWPLVAEPWSVLASETQVA